MTRHPFDSGELGRNDPEMDRIGTHLERYASDVADEPPIDLVARIQASVDEQPVPAAGWWASLVAAFVPWHRAARLAMATTVVAAAVVGALVVSGLAERARNDTGAPPVPSVVGTTPSPLPTPTPTPRATPTPTPTPTSIASPSAVVSPGPTASDDDDELETPEPTESESDNSGPGGGGDNSGPGGGGD